MGASSHVGQMNAHSAGFTGHSATARAVNVRGRVHWADKYQSSDTTTLTDNTRVAIAAATVGNAVSTGDSDARLSSDIDYHAMTLIADGAHERDELRVDATETTMLFAFARF